MQLDLEVFDCFPKNDLHLCVMGSTPIRSNAIAQLVRAIEVYAGSNPAPIKFGWTSPVSQQQTENLSLQSASLLKRCTTKTDLSLSVKLGF